MVKVRGGGGAEARLMDRRPETWCSPEELLLSAEEIDYLVVNRRKAAVKEWAASRSIPKICSVCGPGYTKGCRKRCGVYDSAGITVDPAEIRFETATPPGSVVMVRPERDMPPNEAILARRRARLVTVRA